MDYKNAGVDIEAGYKSVELMKQHIAKTMRPEVLGGIGGFSGAFSMNSFKDMEEPTLVSGTDGVGTKLKLAFIMDKHDTVGIDCVAMCVNDIACAGGEPLFFLDYIACGKNYPEKIAEIVKGVAEGCYQSSAALIGGETAEMPGFYPVDEYDLAGFAVGVVDKKDLITGENLNTGDVLIGMASSGVHSNGFSLVRKVFEMTKESLDTYYDELGTTLGEALIAPTKIYVKALKSIKDSGVKIHACSHITGGGFYENVPRMLKEGTRAVIEKDSYPVLPIFKLLAKIKEMEEPVLLSGTDGCGTKVKLAMIMDKHDTIGIDAVAMCVNDIACAGGEPLFFLDYIACGKNYPEKIASIVSGVAEGCIQSEAALIGGETAEHPGLMPEDEYDLAGFAVGVCDKKDMITGENLKDGDVLIGMASTGVHSNGFSLVRKVFDMTKESLDTYYDDLGTTLGEALLAPTRIYVKALKSIKNAGVTVKACSHITGGGFYENVPRMLIDGVKAVVKKDSYPIPPIFTKLAKEGNVDEHAMYNTYNMGIGMIVAVDPADVDKTMEAIKAAGETPYVVGRIEAGEKGVTLC